MSPLERLKYHVSGAIARGEAEAIVGKPANGYKAFYNGKSTELYAATLLEAKEKAVAFFKAPKSKRHMVSVVLCEKNGETVSHSPSEF